MEYNINDYVKTPGSKNNVAQVVGKRVRVFTEYSVKFPSGIKVTIEEKDLETAPKLTPEEAWLKVPGLIMREIRKHVETNRPSFPSHIIVDGPLYEPDRRAIRHEVYKLLGGASPRIDITDHVREKVADTLEEIA